MNPEIEAKFLKIDVVDMQQRLRDIGATCKQPMTLMKRAILDYPDCRLQTQQNAFIRVRYEGSKTSLTFKQFESLQLGGAQEIETEVADFDKTIAIFQAAGIVVRSMQESKRETWQLGETEIVIDEWPWLEPYIEIEGTNEEAIKAVAEKLLLNWQHAVFGDVMVAYRTQYPHIGANETVGNLPEVRFDMPVPNQFLYGTH